MTSRNLPYYILDVFGQSKYTGNQLAVFTDPYNINSAEMQAIAREFNFSETTFITGVNTRKQRVDVRIFTPGKELPFAGHPILGTAYMANKTFFSGSLQSLNIRVKAGVIPVELDENVCWMKQNQPEFGKQYEKDEVAEVLSLTPSDIDNFYPVIKVSTGIPFIIVPISNLAALKAAKINWTALQKYFGEDDGAEFMVFTTQSYNEVDKIAARVFVPEYGIVEDAATGSANGCLAAYLLKFRVLGDASIKLSVAQGYEIMRPSRIYIDSELSGTEYKLCIGGNVLPLAGGNWD